MLGVALGLITLNTESFLCDSKAKSTNGNSTTQPQRFRIEKYMTQLILPMLIRRSHKHLLNQRFSTQ
jgi:hypothetical protein